MHVVYALMRMLARNFFYDVITYGVQILLHLWDSERVLEVTYVYTGETRLHGRLETFLRGQVSTCMSYPKIAERCIRGSMRYAYESEQYFIWKQTKFIKICFCASMASFTLFSRFHIYFFSRILISKIKGEKLLSKHKWLSYRSKMLKERCFQ